MCLLFLSISSCSSDNEVDNSIEKVCGKYYSPPEGDYCTTMVITICEDYKFYVVEYDEDDYSISESWSGEWSYNKESHIIVFKNVIENEISYTTAVMSDDYKSFSIYDEEDDYTFVYYKMSNHGYSYR